MAFIKCNYIKRKQNLYFCNRWILGSPGIKYGALRIGGLIDVMDIEYLFLRKTSSLVQNRVNRCSPFDGHFVKHKCGNRVLRVH